jgi:hypothetical protein
MSRARAHPGYISPVASAVRRRPPRVNRAVVARPDRLYVKGRLGPAGLPSEGSIMPDIASPLRAPVRPLMLVAAVVAGMLLAVAVGLWVYYGSAVFYEMIAAGLAACF